MSYIGSQPTTAAFVTDQFSGNGSTTAFTMSVAPATPASVLIAVSGVLQDPSTYSVSGTTLTFSAAPPTGTGNISARYLGIPASGVVTTAYRTVTTFTATAGQTTFTPPSYTAGFINVYRNGVFLTPTSDYTATNGTTVVLASGATAGDTVIVESFYVSSVVNAIPATAGAVNSTYLATGAVQQTNLAANVAGNGPAFSASQSSNTSIANNTPTKIQFNSKDFDTANCYDASTNYRFTPNVAGYYQINVQIRDASGVGSGYLGCQLYKNGSVYKQSQGAVGGAGLSVNTSVVLYMNGTTDYLEVYGVQNSGGSMNIGSGSLTYFNGSLVRSA